MICPYCHSHIDDGLEVCPACRKKITVQEIAEKKDPVFCKQCGTLLKDTDVTCPSCGMYCKAKHMSVPSVSMNIPAIDPGATSSIPRIESAIPEEDPQKESKSTSLKPFAVAGGLAVVFVTVLVLIITHPWDPAAYYGRPDQPVDFTKAGPGQIDSLTGQDKKAQAEENITEGNPYEVLTEAYDTLIKLSEDVDGIQLKFRDYGFSNNQQEIEKASKETRLVAIDISNEIAKINNYNFYGTPYESQKEELVKLGNFLRNRIDGYTSAWRASKNSADREADRKKIESYIEKAHANQASFDELKVRCRPHRVEDGLNTNS